MDNAIYHFAIIDKFPNTGPRKKDIQEWLRKKYIEYDPTDTIPELLRVAPYKSREKAYEVDQIANYISHFAIRSPPYQCQYSRLELV
jgi:hypothetical protein